MSSGRCSGWASVPCCAAGMVAYVRTIGSVTLQRPAIPPDAAVIAVLVGIGVTLAAALEPARRAGRIQPVEALKARLDLPSARRARLRWLAGVFVIVTIVGLIAAPRGAGVVQGLVVYAVLLVGTLSIPLVLPAVARLAGLPFRLLLRFEERLARSAVVRDPSRSTLTLGALTIGLAMIVALGGVGQHARAAAGRLDRRRRPGRADPVVDPARRTGRGRRGRPQGGGAGHRPDQPDRHVRRCAPGRTNGCGGRRRCRPGRGRPPPVHGRRPGIGAGRDRCRWRHHRAGGPGRPSRTRRRDRH